MYALRLILLFLATVTTGLMAGLFYNWSTAICPGLAGVRNDAAYISAMQSINRAIQNPAFFAGFIGAAVLLPTCAALHYRRGRIAFALLLAAALLYLGGVIGVTAAGNIPLNNALDAFVLKGATDADISAQRAAFEQHWARLNAVRTVASVLAFMCITIVCLYCSPARQRKP